MWNSTLHLWYYSSDYPDYNCHYGNSTENGNRRGSDWFQRSLWYCIQLDRIWWQWPGDDNSSISIVRNVSNFWLLAPMSLLLSTYSHGQELFYNTEQVLRKPVSQKMLFFTLYILSMTVVWASNLRIHWSLALTEINVAIIKKYLIIIKLVLLVLQNLLYFFSKNFVEI